MTAEDTQLTGLRERFPGWQIWYIRPAVSKKCLWSANPWSKQEDRRGVLHADSAEDLVRIITKAQEQEGGL
jgi:hypothetical protein